MALDCQSTSSRRRCVLKRAQRAEAGCQAIASVTLLRAITSTPYSVSLHCETLQRTISYFVQTPHTAFGCQHVKTPDSNWTYRLVSLFRLGDTKGGEKEWLLSEVVDDMDGMSRFLNYDKFSDCDSFVPAITLAPGGTPIPTPTPTATASPYWRIGSEGQPTTSGALTPPCLSVRSYDRISIFELLVNLHCLTGDLG
jgi:hypothetical protein